MANFIVDKTCDDIANYLGKKFNLITKEKYKFLFIKSTRNWNDKNVPLNDYPVLKVYRSGDKYRIRNYKVFSNITIEYVFALKQDARYVPFLNYFGKILHSLMGGIEEILNITISPLGEITGNIEILNEKSGNVFGIYTYNFSIEDSSLPQDLAEYLLTVVE